MEKKALYLDDPSARIAQEKHRPRRPARYLLVAMSVTLFLLATVVLANGCLRLRHDQQDSSRKDLGSDQSIPDRYEGYRQVILQFFSYSEKADTQHGNDVGLISTQHKPIDNGLSRIVPQLNQFIAEPAERRAQKIDFQAQRKTKDPLTFARIESNAVRSVENDLPPGCSVPNPSKIDCYPGGGASQQACEARGCCWVPVNPNPGNAPWCFYKADNNATYSMGPVVKTPFGFSASLTKQKKSQRWPNDILSLKLDVYLATQNRLHFKIYDPKNERYEVPIQTPPEPKRASTLDYDVTFNKNPFAIMVKRKSTGTMMFDSSHGLLTFADQFLQISTSLPTQYIYGLGEHRDSLLHDATKPHTFGFYARDQPPSERINLYGVHTLYIGLENDGSAFGVFLLNSNAMQVDMTPGSPPTLTYTTVGGILDFYVFTGPTPNDVIAQYTAVIGRPTLPPYWSLGFHLCRWGYGGTDGMRKVIQRMRAAKMPYDTQWNDIDYMDIHEDWSYDKKNFAGLPDVVKDLHQNGQHYVMIVDPGISNQKGYEPYDSGVKAGVFIMDANGTAPIIGKVWPGTTAYPDFTNPAAVDYWVREAKGYHDQVPFDGIWCDMNEPSNFVKGSINGCPKSKWDNPPYFPPAVAGGSPSDKTICGSAVQKAGRHYDLHSLYGHTEGIASKKAVVTITGKRGLIISRSTFPSSGVYVGHWLGDNNAQEHDLQSSIPGVLNFNFFGIPLVGADICGFQGDTNTNLCTRWMQAGAFYPFMRNHNTKGAKDQDPANPDFGKAAQDAIRNVLLVRYRLLPFLYTLFFQASVNGTGVARPLFFKYPTDPATYGIDQQFMWGDSLLISPVLANVDQARSVQAYLPNDVWYDFFNGSLLTSNGGQVALDAPLDKINLHVRGGSIIPTQEPDVTTTLSRRNKFGLLVALSPKEDSTGMLFWDDGDSVNPLGRGEYNLITFTAGKGGVNSMVLKSGYKTTMTLGSATIFGVASAPSTVTANGKAAKFSYNTLTKTLNINDLSLSLLQPVKLAWT
ncbi:lysosomal alpha-glucosidase [Lingula anatina]|uniref:Lysosomal alpha-glucosidase n=1 Tax=Lingula anatina TaxID=7574 RepID=A0A2R2MIX6_LINAN|nr:lysosomal alpha-glucosidase [Lingula anatina]|eukprot:XP_023930007.1 lysosomal alpha-glucosidase [Lingula anatina]